MNINPFLLLGIGSFFALLYACVITVGWAVTRRNRAVIQHDTAYSEVPLFAMSSMDIDRSHKVRTVSLNHNQFVDSQGVPLNLDEYEVCVAHGNSPHHPKVNDGDLLLVDKGGHKILYAFEMPDLNSYR